MITLFCEFQERYEWLIMPVVAALHLNPEIRKRCPECLGEIVACWASGELPDRFEHIEPHSGCSLSHSVPFSGTKTQHPKALL